MEPQLLDILHNLFYGHGHVKEVYSLQDKELADRISATGFTCGENMIHLAIRALGGKIAVGIEEQKLNEVSDLSFSKEDAIEQIEKIHDFLSLAIWKNDNAKDKSIFMDEEPYCNLVDALREVVGTGILPEGVYMWKGLDQIEGLRTGLQAKIYDIEAHMSVTDMRIGHLLDQNKQMLESLRIICNQEKDLVDSIIRKSSKSAAG